MFGPCFVVQYIIPLCNYLEGGKIDGCFTLIAFMKS